MILPDQGTHTTIMGPSSRFSRLLFSILNPCNVGAASLNEKTKQRLFIINISLSIQYSELYMMIPYGYIQLYTSFMVLYELLLSVIQISFSLFDVELSIHFRHIL